MKTGKQKQKTKISCKFRPTTTGAEDTKSTVKTESAQGRFASGILGAA